MAKSSPKRSLIAETKSAALARNTARLAALLALIRRRMTEVVEGFYDLGEALREVLDKKLYAAAGHASLDAWLRAEKLMSVRQANKLVSVVRRVPREQALALGHERAYALVAYTDATPADDTPASLLAQSAKIGATPVAEASLREIQAATRTARSTAKRAPTAAERTKTKADAATVKAVRAVLREAGIGRADVVVHRDGVRIEISHTLAARLTRG